MASDGRVQFGRGAGRRAGGGEAVAQRAERGPRQQRLEAAGLVAPKLGAGRDRHQAEVPGIAGRTAADRAAEHDAATERRADRQGDEVVEVSAMATEQLRDGGCRAIVLGQQRGIELNLHGGGEIVAAPRLVRRLRQLGTPAREVERGREPDARELAGQRRAMGAQLVDERDDLGTSGVRRRHRAMALDDVQRLPAEIDDQPDQRVAPEADADRPDAVRRQRQQRRGLAAPADALAGHLHEARVEEVADDQPDRVLRQPGGTRQLGFRGRAEATQLIKDETGVVAADRRRIGAAAARLPERRRRKVD